MPAAIGAAVLGELALDSIIGTTIAGVSAETLVGYAVITGGLAGLQYGAQALQGGQKRADEQITVRQAVAARRRLHGRGKLGGVIFFLDTAPFSNDRKVLFRGAVHAVGPLTVREFWLGDVRTALPPGPGGVVPDAVYQGKVSIEWHPGADPQDASAALLRFPYWDATCRLNGLAYSVVVATPLKKGDQIFPEGAPDVRVVADGVPCRDPRDGAVAWSDNAAIVLLDYLTHDSGYGLGFDEIDLDSFRALADTCDEAVPLAGPDPTGATAEPRYRSWGVYDYSEERATVLGRLLSACDGELYQDADGLVAARGGRWQPPTFTITQGMVLGWDQFEEGDEAYSSFTRVKHTYTSPFHDYQPVEGDPWDDPAAQDLQGVVETERDFKRAPSHGQSRRLAKIAMAKGNPRFRITGLRLRPAGLPAYGEATVRLVLPSFDTADEVFDHTFSVVRGALSGAGLATTTVDLIALGPEAYAWDPASEEGTAPPLPDVYT